MKAERVAACGSVASGVLASACCIVPLALAILGVSGGALAMGFEPYRPYLLVAAYGLLGFAFYLSTHHPGVTPKNDGGLRGAQRSREEGHGLGSGEACAPYCRSVRGSRGLLWIAALAVVLATAFPWYARFLPL